MNQKPKAIVLLADGFEEIEAITPLDLLRRSGIETLSVSLGDLTVKSARGIPVLSDTTLKNVLSREDWDACILPGGGVGAKNLAASQELKVFLRKMNQQGKWIAAICASPAEVLAPFGILDQRAATCYPGMESAFSPSTRHSPQSVVVDGNVITSQGPGTSIEFALTIIEKLRGKDIRNTIAKAILLP